jgi:hypothetical protein
MKGDEGARDIRARALASSKRIDGNGRGRHHDGDDDDDDDDCFSPAAKYTLAFVIFAYILWMVSMVLGSKKA